MTSNAGRPVRLSQTTLKLFKFQMFQRKVHENLTQLEILNKQYRRLAREGRTDQAQHLKTMVHQANSRWDDLARRCSAILRRLRYAQGQKEEFAACKESMHVWLTEMDLQLTNVEHFSESDISVKIKQMMVRFFTLPSFPFL